MPKYEVKGRLEHDGEEVEIGTTVELTEQAAVNLLHLGIIAPVKAAKGKEPQGGTNTEQKDA